MRNLLIITTLLFTSSNVFAASQAGRLGVGMSNHLVTGMQSISLKLQRNRSSAFGGLFGVDSSSDGSFYALGLKYYKLIYEEPQLNFYSSFGAATFTYENTVKDKTDQGYQIDGLFGAEFQFQGIESVGFSFEFGLGIYKYLDETHIATRGYNMIMSAIHFYL